MPKSLENYAHQASLLFHQKMPSHAIQCLEDGLANYPNNTFFLRELALLHEKCGELETAQLIWKKRSP